jgi:hypothetical protein
MSASESVSFLRAQCRFGAARFAPSDAAYGCVGEGRKSAYCLPIYDQHRSCKCGAVYRRTESMAISREINSFECSVCGDTMESWNTAWVPTYKLIVGPI